jgi:hypothetical protein
LVWLPIKGEQPALVRGFGILEEGMEKELVASLLVIGFYQSQQLASTMVEEAHDVTLYLYAGHFVTVGM